MICKATGCTLMQGSDYNTYSHAVRDNDNKYICNVPGANFYVWQTTNIHSGYSMAVKQTLNTAGLLIKLSEC